MREEVKQTAIGQDKLARRLRRAQENFRAWDADSPELWFATLELESVTLEPNAAAFVLRDPVDDARYGWRWMYLCDDLGLMSAHLAEDLNESEPTEPDENGIRWLGVHLFVGDEEIPDCPKCGARDVEPGETYTAPARDGRPPTKDDWWRCRGCDHEWMTVRFPTYADGVRWLGGGKYVVNDS